MSGGHYSKRKETKPIVIPPLPLWSCDAYWKQENLLILGLGSAADFANIT